GRLDYLRSMGVVTIGIVCALLLALTLLPSVLMLIGDRIFWPSRFDRQVKRRENGYFTRSAKFSIRHAKAILVAAVLISIPATYLVFTVETSYDYIESMPNTQAKEGLDVLTEGFGGGKVVPTYVGLELDGPLYNASGAWNVEYLDTVNNVSLELMEFTNVKKVYSPTQPYGDQIDYKNITGNISISAQLYNQYMRTMIGDDTRSVLMTVIFVQEPFSRTSFETIDDMRDQIEKDNENSKVLAAAYVGGGTAMMYDITALTQADFQIITMVVIAGIFLVLMLVLGSVLNPLRSVLTILISISWTLAVALLVFEHGFGQSLNWMVPLILLVVCLGLGMDYDILLSTRVREETHRGRTNNEAIIYSVEQTGGIITACGIIMAGAFGTMMLSQGWLLREFGFALMFAILLDATIVRIYMVPAIMSLLGKWNWWAPGPLQRTRLDHQEDGADAKAAEEVALKEVERGNN
ncbi:MAG TPA: MMPL family transporter, partial [Methanomassiliicoccales archaeon]|nr:MMPL family transporter [Methanomassiliicoccales archaeon]